MLKLSLLLAPLMLIPASIEKRWIHIAEPFETKDAVACSTLELSASIFYAIKERNPDVGRKIIERHDVKKNPKRRYHRHGYCELIKDETLIINARPDLEGWLSLFYDYPKYHVSVVEAYRPKTKSKMWVFLQDVEIEPRRVRPPSTIRFK